MIWNLTSMSKAFRLRGVSDIVSLSALQSSHFMDRIYPHQRLLPNDSFSIVTWGCKLRTMCQYLIQLNACLPHLTCKRHRTLMAKTVLPWALFYYVISLTLTWPIWLIYNKMNTVVLASSTSWDFRPARYILEVYLLTFVIGRCGVVLEKKTRERHSTPHHNKTIMTCTVSSKCV